MIALAPADKCSRVRCQEPRIEGRDLCEEHSETLQAQIRRKLDWQKKKREERATNGVCSLCGKPVYRGARCQKCWEYQRAYQAKLETRRKRAERYDAARLPETRRNAIPIRSPRRVLSESEARELERQILAGKPRDDDPYAPPTKIEPEFDEEEHELRYLELLEFKRKGLSIGGREPAQLCRPTHTEKGYA